ncbi:MAG: hypothetical protein JWO79_1762, partial [Actinomycetia bacterium]|nr:hypothetical protein [Actinomycetes bacterium]
RPPDLERRLIVDDLSLLCLEFPPNSGQSLAVGLVMRSLVLVWGNVPQCRVPADPVVERLDVLEDARLRLRAGGVVLVVNQFLLERAISSLHSVNALSGGRDPSVSRVRLAPRAVCAGRGA